MDLTVLAKDTDSKKLAQMVVEIEEGIVQVIVPPTKDFAPVALYKTLPAATVVYQKESKDPKHPDRVWSPVKPAGPGPWVKAVIPKGTVVVVGLRAGATLWYIKDTYTPPGLKPPASWKVSKES